MGLYVRGGVKKLPQKCLRGLEWCLLLNLYPTKVSKFKETYAIE